MSSQKSHSSWLNGVLHAQNDEERFASGSPNPEANDDQHILVWKEQQALKSIRISILPGSSWLA